MKDKSLVILDSKFGNLPARLLRIEWAEGKMQIVIDLGNSLLRNVGNSQNILPRGLRNASDVPRAAGGPQSAQNDILQLTARPRRSITGKLTDSTSNRKHIVTGHHVRTMLHVLYVERVRVVANMDNICPLNHINKAFGENDELIEVAQPLGGSATH
jgi:hypothetical protein